MWNVFSRDVGYVPMVRKNYDLAVACKVGEGFEHGPGSVLVGCHEDIVQNDREVDAGSTPHIERCQPQSKVELIKSAFAHRLDANPKPAAALCDQYGFLS